ncbi:MAG: hypothetical protein ACXAC2_25180, partial [Candidatus Kariarchaeaceae archaeon]
CTINFEYKPNHILVIQTGQLGVKVISTYPYDLNYKIEGNRAIKTDIPSISSLTYSTGFVTGLTKEAVSRFIEIGGSTYLIEFWIWD